MTVTTATKSHRQLCSQNDAVVITKYVNNFQFLQLVTFYDFFKVRPSKDMFNFIVKLFILFDLRDYHGTLAEPTCPSVPVFDEKNLDFFDRAVIGDFKVWQLAFMAAAVALVIIIVLCCLFRCRIPRTKQEIEADFARRRVTKQFRHHLNKLPTDDLELIKVLNKVHELEEQRVKKGSVEVKMSFMDKLKSIFGGDDDTSGGPPSSIEEDLASEDNDEPPKVNGFVSTQISIELQECSNEDLNMIKTAVEQIHRADPENRMYLSVEEPPEEDGILLKPSNLTSSEELTDTQLLELQEERRISCAAENWRKANEKVKRQTFQRRLLKLKTPEPEPEEEDLDIEVGIRKEKKSAEKEQKQKKSGSEDEEKKKKDAEKKMKKCVEKKMEELRKEEEKKKKEEEKKKKEEDKKRKDEEKRKKEGKK